MAGCVRRDFGPLDSVPFVLLLAEQACCRDIVRRVESFRNRQIFEARLLG
jgi:hypothetical protein